MTPKTVFSLALFFFMIVVIVFLVCFFPSKRLHLTRSEELVPCKLCFGTQPLLPEVLQNNRLEFENKTNISTYHKIFHLQAGSSGFLL